jgi:hypothetical protein
MPAPARIDATVRAVDFLGPGPVTVAGLHAVGVAYGRIRAAVGAGALITLRRGVVMSSAGWASGSPDERRGWALQAALLAFPGAHASHASAAWLWRLPDFGMCRPPGDGIPDTHITLAGAARREDWLTVHGVEGQADTVVERDGVRVTGLVRTSIEASSTRSLQVAVACIDAAMRRHIEMQVPASGLREAALDPQVRAEVADLWRTGLRPFAGHRWVTRVRLAVAWAEPASESVLESLSRVALLEAGLPRPRCGAPVRGDDGRTYWVDALWREQRLIGEADGVGKYVDVASLVAEKRRQEALEGAGWTVVRWGWDDVYPDPRTFLTRVRRALRHSPAPTRPTLL